MRLFGELTYYLRSKGNESGQVTTWTVCLALLLFGIMALTIDLGFWFVDRRSAQNQADAAALAAVQALPSHDTATSRDLALSYLEKNGAARESICTATAEYPEVDDGVAFGGFSEKLGYERVRVCLQRDGILIFTSILGLTDIQIPGVAAAGLVWEPLRYSLMAMNPDGCSPADGGQSMTFEGSPIVTLKDDGATYTASPCTSENTLHAQGSSVISGAYHDFCGRAGEQGGDIIGDLHPGYCGIPDPWVTEAQPAPGTCRPSNKYSSPLNPNDGAYCKEFDVKEAVVFLPGIHVFRAGIKMTGHSITGTDVVLYFTCNNGQATCNGATPAEVQITGGDINLSAPEVYPRIVIWVDRTAKEGNKSLLEMEGNGALEINGNIYNFGGTVEIGGTGDGTNRSLDGTVLGDKIYFRGTATYDITWDEEFAPRISIITLVE